MRVSSNRALTAAALLLLVACGDRAGERDAGANGDATYGGTAVVAGSNDLDVANSLVTADRYTKEILRHVLFTTLVVYDSALDYRPYLAKSWEMLGDTGVVFRLRDDVYWHDSVRTTAYDVLFTFERAKQPETAFSDAVYFANWDRAEVQDSFTIRFSFRPHADPLASWVFTAVMPRHLLERILPAELRNAPFNKRPVGNGPFRFVEYRPNDRWIFAANPDFPEALGGRPYLDRLVWRVIPERTAQVNELQIGAVDLAVNVGADHIGRLDSLPDVRGIVRPSRLGAHIFWNGKRPPFDDPRVRRALTMAIDRQEILDVLRQGRGQLAVTPVPPSHWAFDDGLAPLPFDTARTGALLDSAGISDRDGDGVRELPGGGPFRFGLKIPANSEFNRDVATMLQSDFAAVGVRMDIVPTEATTLYSDVGSPERRFDATFLAMETDFRLDLRDQFHSGEIEGPYQAASYRNAEVDRLLEELMVTVDRESARPLWRRLQLILREEQPWTFMYFYPELLAARERLQGLEMDIRGTLVNAPAWWLADVASRDTARN